VERAAVERRRAEHARALAEAYGCAVLLKGSTTVVAPPGGRGTVRVNPTGTSWLATAGSGDVLSGLTGSLLAAGLDPVDAGSVGAYLHGLAARLVDGPLVAVDVAAAVREAWRQVTAAQPAG
jgi:NAD(P)H-hydrate repair Nnr-like enzyme with NAD(P)H-hydrate dehydratase domain